MDMGPLHPTDDLNYRQTIDDHYSQDIRWQIDRNGMDNMEGMDEYHLDGMGLNEVGKMDRMVFSVDFSWLALDDKQIMVGILVNAAAGNSVLIVPMVKHY